jgi:hypothetical protein
VTGPWEESRLRVAVAGRVADEATGRPVGGARVETVEFPAAFRDALALAARAHGAGWDDLPLRPDRVLTAADGTFFLTGLPDGRYVLRASVPAEGSRRGVARATVRVTDGRAGGPARFALPRTTVQGRVTAAGGEPVPMAGVRLRGSGERAFTDADGRFVLAGVEAGERTLEVLARGHAPAVHAASLPLPGWTATADVPLEGA